MKCMHHNDLDGFTSAYIVKRFTEIYNPESSFTDYYVNNYSDNECYENFIKAIKPNEDVYIVDISFTESTKKYLDRILDKTDNVYWCDHHDSSIVLCEKYEKYNSIKGIRSKGFCGAILTFSFLFSDREISPFLEYVDDFDCWKWKLEDTLYFKYGAEIYPLSLDSELFNIPPSDIIESGKLIAKYQKLKDEHLIKNKMFEYTLPFKGRNYKCYVVNSTVAGSLVFGDYENQCDIAITFSYNGKVWTYGLYSSKDDVDVSKIAEHFGGGGHKGASGFSHSEFLFNNDNKLWNKFSKNIWN